MPIKLYWEVLNLISVGGEEGGGVNPENSTQLWGTVGSSPMGMVGESQPLLTACISVRKRDIAYIVLHKYT